LKKKKLAPSSRLYKPMTYAFLGNLLNAGGRAALFGKRGALIAALVRARDGWQ
jgi:hypothetical protein